MKCKFVTVLTFFCLLICGCATWQLITPQYKWKFANFEATLPDGWMRFNATPILLYTTKDGEYLQSITILRYKIGDAKSLPISKKKFIDQMLSQEIAEAIINEMTLDGKNVQNLKVLDNSPINIAGKDGFKLEYTFNTSTNLDLKAIKYGFKEKGYIYIIQYQAAEQYYFEKDIGTFKQFVNDFKII